MKCRKISFVHNIHLSRRILPKFYTGHDNVAPGLYDIGERVGAYKIIIVLIMSMG